MHARDAAFSRRCSASRRILISTRCCVTFEGVLQLVRMNSAHARMMRVDVASSLHVTHFFCQHPDIRHGHGVASPRPTYTRKGGHQRELTLLSVFQPSMHFPLTPNVQTMTCSTANFHCDLNSSSQTAGTQGRRRRVRAHACIPHPSEAQHDKTSRFLWVEGVEAGSRRLMFWQWNRSSGHGSRKSPLVSRVP